MEFLLIAKQQQQAFQVAQTHDQMDAYLRFAGDGINPEDMLSVAGYYETRGSVATAAQLYAKCGQPSTALRLYMQVLLALRFPQPQKHGMACAPSADRPNMVFRPCVHVLRCGPWSMFCLLTELVHKTAFGCVLHADSTGLQHAWALDPVLLVSCSAMYDVTLSCALQTALAVTTSFPRSELFGQKLR